MVTIRLITSDSYVWNKIEVVSQFTSAVCNNQSVCIDLLSEGSAFENLDIFDSLIHICREHNYNLDNITVTSCNTYQQSVDQINFETVFPNHFVFNTVKKLEDKPINKDITKTFGIFVGRSNCHRLDLSSYLFNRYRQQTNQTFHYDYSDDYHKNNLGLDTLVELQGTDDLASISNFLRHCPIRLQETVEYPILMNQHCNMYSQYRNFFVEIVCETSYVGNTFFPTEKIWRPIIMQTPFIVQGSQHFLHRLQKLGFKTFNQWWDEGYAEDPADWQPGEIKKVIDRLAKKPADEIKKIYNEMLPTLEHNRQLLLDMNKDFIASIPCTN